MVDFLHRRRSGIAAHRRHDGERTGRASEARQYYTDYLKILPHGPFAEEAHKALEKLSVEK